MKRTPPVGQSLAFGLVVLGLVALGLAGGCSTTIDADDYERSCQQDAECVIISVGDICDCSCEVSAINQVDLPKYFDDRDVDCSKQCGPCPEAPPAACVAGVCQAGP